MKLILFNTCGAEASVALADTALTKPVVAVSTMPGRTASESLVAEVRKTMVEARWGLKDLDGIVVVVGPGSFTGVRVGLSAAKGLGETIGVPMMGVSRLAMLAAAVGPGYRRVCALLDAGRGEFYCGQYGEGFEVREMLISKQDAPGAALLAETVVVCEQVVWEVVREALDGLVPVMLAEEPGAGDALPFAMQKIEKGAFDDSAELDASYLRRTDAEIFSAPAKRAG